MLTSDELKQIREVLKEENNASEKRVKIFVRTEIKESEERMKKHVNTEINESEKRVKDYVNEQVEDAVEVLTEITHTGYNMQENRIEKIEDELNIQHPKKN